MRHKVREFKVGRRTDHVRSMLANQVCSLFKAGRIKTTVVKAKETRRLAEKMITLGKKGTLHCRRQAISKMRDTDSVGQLFAEVAPRYLNREGGYTRIIRIGTRRGDAAEMCYLELVEDSVAKKTKKADKADKVEVPTTEEEVIEATAEVTEKVEASAEEAAEEETKEEA